MLGPDANLSDLEEQIGDGSLARATKGVPHLPLRFRFGVLFFHSGRVPNPIDVRFQKVSGLSTTLETAPLKQGGQNVYTQRLPTGMATGNLVLERGAVVQGSLLNIEINAALSLFKLAPSNVLVTLFNESFIPVMAWFFFKAFPVKWATSDLDANERGILIDTIELAYQRMQIMRI